MFNNLVSLHNLDTSSSSYRDMLHQIERHFRFKHTDRAGHFTQHTDGFILHGLTKSFYAAHHPDIFTNYVPLYHSAWKQRLKDVLNISNAHQDAGVHFFSRNGYDSRMINIWTNVHKEPIPGLSASDLGIFIIDNTLSPNRDLYEQMIRQNSHFFEKRPGQLMDNMHIGGAIIKFDTNRVVQTYFDYQEGTSIRFNSHLLHGSKRLGHSPHTFSEEQLNNFRVSLTSVWLHRDDVSWDVVNMPESAHESLYLSRVAEAERAEVRKFFGVECENENQRLLEIKKLIQEHLREHPHPSAAN